MNELKVRAWHSETKEMIYMVEGFTNKQSLCYFFAYLPESAIILQFAGITDKNGKEVYEGDIFKLYNDLFSGTEDGFLNNLYLMEFKDGCFGYEFSNCFVDTAFLVEHNFKLEVIGNLYENPELLEEVKECKI